MKWTNFKMVLKRIALNLFIFSTLFSLLLTNTSAQDTFESYNLELEVPEEYRSLIAGEKIWFTTKILNLANKNRVDITLKYSLIDSEGEEINTRSETVAIETQASYVGSIDIPIKAMSGEYFLTAEMISDSGEVAMSSTKIKVLEKKELGKLLKENLLWIFLVPIVVLLIFTSLKFKPIIDKHNKRKKIDTKIKRMIKDRISDKKITSEEIKYSKIKRINLNENRNEEKIF